MFTAQVITYFALAIAVIAMIVKALRYMKAPEHMRWELYPVPHEKGKAEYGGSYLEEFDWWTKPRETDTVNELKEMTEEIILLKGVYKNNKTVWVSSFPFHLGLYLTIGWLMLLLLGGILQLSGMSINPQSGLFASIIHFATIATGYAGLFLTGIGALGLLIWRSTDSEQRRFNSPSDYFNLVAFIVVCGLALYTQFTMDASFVAMRSYAQSLITFGSFTSPGVLFNIEVVLVALLIMYIPLTRMSHFVAKYFLYHDVRWNDTPNERGSKIEKRIAELLKQKVGWSAPHIKTGKSWGEVITDNKEISNE
jgi:nitrate reductase gamma subunit